MPIVLREAGAGDGAADRLRAVLALYRGDFLEDIGARDWHLELRDHLRRLHVDGLLALSERLMHAGDYAAAAETCQRIVARDALLEEAHRRLIVWLARSGARSRALQQYERLVALLREELAAVPEPEAVELYERLKHAASA